MKKRGLSNIIATVLIILLALVAVALVWGFVRSILNTSTDSTAQTELMLSQTRFSITQKNVNGDLQLTIKRNTGGKNISGVIINFVESNGNIIVYGALNQTPIKEFGSETITITANDLSIQSLNTIEKIEIYPLAQQNEKQVISQIATAIIEYRPSSAPPTTPTYTPITSCTTISSAGEYKLTTNINATANVGPCIKITAQNVILDGDNKEIFGNGSSEGIVIEANFSTLTKITIRDLITGINVSYGTQNAKITDTEVNESTHGLYIYNTGNLNVTNSKFNSNLYGISIFGTNNTNAELVSNEFCSTSACFSLPFGASITLTPGTINNKLTMTSSNSACTTIKNSANRTDC